MRKLFALILALTMLVSLFAGCGSTAEAPAEAGSDAPVVSEAEPEAEDDATEADEPDWEDSELEEDAPEAKEVLEPRVITLPITEDVVTYSYWCCYAPFAADLVDTSTMQGLAVLDELQRITNIHFDITAANGAAEQDNFNLMVAAGDYCDILFAMGYYGTGLEGAVEDGIIQDLAELLPEKCPSYWSKLSEDTSTLMAAYTDSGYMPTVCALLPENGQEVVGPVVRGDWLKEFEMDVPQTYDALYDYLKKALDEKGAHFEQPTTDGLNADIGYGVGLALDTNNGADTYSVVDGEVVFSFATDGFKDYLKFMNRLATDGIIPKDFFSSTNADLSSQSRLDFGLGTNSLVSVSAANSSDIMMNAEEGFEMAVLPYVSPDGSETHVGTPALVGRMKDNDAWAFSADCDDIDPLLDMVEYLFTDDAYLLTNYGVEDVAYTLDENGDPHYTDLIVNNPDGLSYFFASYVYASNAAWSFVPFVNDLSRTFYDFTDNQWEVYDGLRTLSDCRDNYPTYAAMTIDETEEYASIESDLGTYMDSRILEFITGAADIDKEFDAYVETLYDMGLQDMIDIKQAAYDRAADRSAELIG
ncbi:MAG: extracellular solute-binding protein [Oscillospiraceae bacterium]|nr:extracellular solute-binding protein [Oscillospiraceae bacterium]